MARHQTIFTRIPLLRILVSFVAGILIAEVWHTPIGAFALMAIALILEVTITLIARNRLSLIGTSRVFHTIALMLIGVSLGWLASLIAAPPTLDLNSVKGRWLFARIETVRFTDNSMNARATLLGYKDDDKVATFAPTHNLRLTTGGCNYLIKPGDLVMWQGALEPVTNMGNPDEPDYAAMQRRQGIIYQQHCAKDKVFRVGTDASVFTRCKNWRHDLCKKIFNSSLSDEAQFFVIALILGDTEFIDADTRRNFANAGVAHVLALSGLHIGIITILIYWLLFPLARLNLRRTRLTVTSLIIIAYAVFTGATPSVIRATIMTLFVFIAEVNYSRRNTSLNALVGSALLILLFKPSALFQVGFQLSFITVTSILVFYPKLNAISPRHRVRYYFTSLIVTSCIAIASTLMLTAYYFHAISWTSVISNLILLPFFPLVMTLSFAYVFAIALNFDFAPLAQAIDALYNAMTWVIAQVNALPMGHMRGVDVSRFAVICYYILLVMLAIFVYRRKKRYLLCASLMLILMLSHAIVEETKMPSRGYVIFNAYSETPVLCYESDTAYLWIPDADTVDVEAFKLRHEAFFARRRITEVIAVDTTHTMERDKNVIRPPYALLSGRRMMAVGRGRWKHMVKRSELTLDDIIVTKRFHSTPQVLKDLFNYDRIILSGDIYHTNRTTLIDSCQAARIPYYDIKTQGAIIVEE